MKTVIMNLFSFIRPNISQTQPIRLSYNFSGQQKICAVKEVQQRDRVTYKCCLLPYILEITIERIEKQEGLQWVHDRQIVNDLANAIGKSIENHRKLKSRHRRQKACNAA